MRNGFRNFHIMMSLKVMKRKKLTAKGMKVIRKHRKRMKKFEAEVIQEEILNGTLVHLQNRMMIRTLSSNSKVVFPM